MRCSRDIIYVSDSWTPVKGWPGYEVSAFGNVRSVDREIAGRDGNVVFYPGRVLRQQKRVVRGALEAMTVGFKCAGPTGKRFKSFKVHRLVLEAFVGPCPEGMVGCHNDGDPTNNRLSNLRWDTQESNIADKQRHGTAPALKLTDDQVREIRATPRYTRGLKEKYGVNASTFSVIRSGRIRRAAGN